MRESMTVLGRLEGVERAGRTERGESKGACDDGRDVLGCCMEWACMLRSVWSARKEWLQAVGCGRRAGRRGRSVVSVVERWQTGSRCG